MEENKNLQPEAISEEVLEKVAGGIFGTTKNRYDPNLCKDMNGSDAERCKGSKTLGVWCDHFRKEKTGGRDSKVYHYSCVMDGFEPHYASG